jgi:hypothetical protein
MSYATDARPTNLSEVIGYKDIVDKLTEYAELIAAGGRAPKAIALMGSTSAGKTTLARAFAATVLNNPALYQTGKGIDYREINVASERTIDDVRSWAVEAQSSPMLNKVKIYLLDEAQGILSNQNAAGALLKLIEDSPQSTLWIVASMEPEKFASTQNGKALLNRCVTFKLNGLTAKERYKYAARIAKQHNLDVDTEYLTKLATSTEILRDIANALEGGSAVSDNITETFDYQFKVLTLLTKSHVDSSVSPNDMLSYVWTTMRDDPSGYARNVLNAFDGYAKLIVCGGKLPYGMWVPPVCKEAYAAAVKKFGDELSRIPITDILKGLVDTVALTVSGGGVPLDKAVPVMLANLMNKDVMDDYR